jgi:hypothetical protein
MVEQQGRFTFAPLLDTGVKWRQLQSVEKVTPCHHHYDRALGTLSSVEM